MWFIIDLIMFILSTAILTLSYKEANNLSSRILKGITNSILLPFYVIMTSTKTVILIGNITNDHFSRIVTNSTMAFVIGSLAFGIILTYKKENWRVEKWRKN